MSFCFAKGLCLNLKQHQHAAGAVRSAFLTRKCKFEKNKKMARVSSQKAFCLTVT
jgi:hypothetical protein